ncbi:MAG TPA: ABC transporter permease [Verrucomicrobiae bacterium]|nr:ABC transporter permease [Verrucomicrobiae bacterium]
MPRTVELEYVGGKVVRFFAHTGAVFILLGRTVVAFGEIGKRIGLWFDQMLFVGVRSLPLIVITSVFTGGVSAWQAAYQFKGYIPLRYLGTAVGKAIVIELAPVLTALVVAGRVGAAMAAEIGTMKVTEQVDALEAMGVNPVSYLVFPRVAGSIIMLPVLTVFADFIAIMGAMAVAVFFVGLSGEIFLNGVKLFFHVSDLVSGLVKAAVFGLIISLVGCYHGLSAEGGAEGVGRSTTRAVVWASVLILVSDYLIATLLFSI